MSALSTMIHGLMSLLAAGLIAGCGSVGSNPATDEISNSVVYDQDDRVEPAGAPAEWAALGARTTLALIPGKRLSKSGSTVHVDAPTLQQTVGACSDEPFAQQPTASECSAVLIDDDLVLTAGHCFSDGDDCDRYAYVFDYAEGGHGVEIPESSVFGCRALISLPHEEGQPRSLDFAVVQLDRIAGRKPADLSVALPVAGDQLAALGYPSGLPLKIDRGGVVLQTGFPTPEYFTATVDAFQGNSGGPIFDVQANLLGILVAGAPTDYETHDGCARARRVELKPDGGERILRQGPVIDALCKLTYPSKRLCAVAPSCGDGTCSPSEQGSDCSADCAVAHCTGLDCLAFPAPPPYLSIPADATKSTGSRGQSNSAGCGVGRGVSGPHGWIAVLCAAWAIRARRRFIPRSSA